MKTRENPAHQGGRETNWSRRGIALLGATAAFFIAAEAQAQKPIRISYPVILSVPAH